MLNWIAIVLGMQLIGELAATLFGLPVPGPVIGMVLLLLLLLYLGRLPDQLERLAAGLLRHLYLYYLPATVGVTAHLALVGSELLPMVTAILVSSILSLAFTGLAIQWLSRKGSGDV
jgi:holin-like protein